MGGRFHRKQANDYGWAGVGRGVLFAEPALDDDDVHGGEGDGGDQDAEEDGAEAKEGDAHEEGVADAHGRPHGVPPAHYLELLFLHQPTRRVREREG